jgi:DNA-directed RNA polymerase subunit RPC12/RpoP
MATDPATGDISQPRIRAVHPPMRLRNGRACGRLTFRMADAPTPGPQHCPTCDATAAKAALLTLAYVYLRCEKCGHVWVIPERRAVPRHPGRIAR